MGYTEGHISMVHGSESVIGLGMGTHGLCGYGYSLGNLYPWLYCTCNCGVMGISWVFQVESKIVPFFGCI